MVFVSSVRVAPISPRSKVTLLLIAADVVAC